MRWAEECFQDWPAIQVPGNHEFYHHDIVQIEALEVQAPNRIHLQKDDQVVIGAVRFPGGILWTDFALFGAANMFLPCGRRDGRLRR
ncbi:MAG: hypothetical protein KDI83_18000 [Gammaproteobacteria bacterium]|nr:hypothetical protein [Gammaproteobacteria bacterium]